MSKEVSQSEIKFRGQALSEKIHIIFHGTEIQLLFVQVRNQVPNFMFKEPFLSESLQ